ncbi:MAG: ATP synthase subunit C [Candidatus Helarchaeota archaeon]
MLVIGLNLIPVVSAAYSTDNTIVGFGLCIASGIYGLAGGYGIAKTGASAISALAEKPNTFVKSFMIVVLAEAVSIYGLLLGIFAYLNF